jgi:hypothetical protein
MHREIIGLITGIILLIPPYTYAQGTLEVPPPPSSFQSGRGIIAGWHCTAQSIEIIVDGTIRAQAAVGLPREDTRTACGGQINTGFDFDMNWNNLSDGQHFIQVLADGVEFARASVIVTTFGTDFLRGASGSGRIGHFPHAGTDTVLVWQEALQGFTIVGVEPTQLPFGPPANFNGTWSGSAVSAITTALSDVGCSAASVTISVDGTGFSGTALTGRGIRLTLSGVIGSDGVLSGQALRDSSFFAVLTGTTVANFITGQWADIFGCWGSFSLQRG